MRYYKIKITDPKSGKLYVPPSMATLNLKDASWTSYINGQSLGAALNIQFDFDLAPGANPRQGSWLRIWGISLEEISQSTNLGPQIDNAGNLQVGKSIEVWAGMARGLPLAKPKQQGLIMTGSIQQAFGNWAGTDMTLDMIVMPNLGTIQQPSNLMFNWLPNTPLADAIRTTLSAAFPAYTLDISISGQFRSPANYTAPGNYPTFDAFASMIKNLTNSTQYSGAGVDMTVRGKTIYVYDASAPASSSNPTEIAFEDLVGQPTWVGAQTINFRTVMRGDILVGDYIKLPSTLATPYVLTTPGAAYPNVAARNGSTFKGTFRVTEVHQFGNYRQADANSWVTMIDAIAPAPTSSNTSNVPPPQGPLGGGGV